MNDSPSESNAMPWMERRDGESPGVPTSETTAEVEFGIVDMVEAFTAMRHEWRGQSRDSRELAQELAAAVNRLGQLEGELRSLAGNGQKDADAARRLADALVELDGHVSRAIESTIKYVAHQPRVDLSPVRTAAQNALQNLNPLARWFCRPFWQQIAEQLDDVDRRHPTLPDSTLQGLSLLGSRVRQLLSDRQIDRIETAGQPFDPERMNAVESVETTTFPRGHVVEQLNPAYVWRGHLIRYADVRVAR